MNSSGDITQKWRNCGFFQKYLNKMDDNFVKNAISNIQKDRHEAEDVYSHYKS
jgi:hypothetical protein